MKTLGFCPNISQTAASKTKLLGLCPENQLRRWGWEFPACLASAGSPPYKKEKKLVVLWYESTTQKILGGPKTLDFLWSKSRKKTDLPSRITRFWTCLSLLGLGNPGKMGTWFPLGDYG